MSGREQDPMGDRKGEPTKRVAVKNREEETHIQYTGLSNAIPYHLAKVAINLERLFREAGWQVFEHAEFHGDGMWLIQAVPKGQEAPIISCYGTEHDIMLFCGWSLKAYNAKGRLRDLEPVQEARYDPEPAEPTNPTKG